MDWDIFVASLALALGVWNLWRSEQRNRQAALVLTYVDQELVIENRGPASARAVSLITGVGERARVDGPVSLLPAGYVHRVPYVRMVGEIPTCVLSWKDGRLREQRLELAPSQQRSTTPGAGRPPLTDRQVTDLADGLAAGLAQGFKDHLASAARSVPRRGRRF